MISPIHIITLTLGTAFFIGLLKKLNLNISALLMLVAIAAAGTISASWFTAILSGAANAEVFTAGFNPPYSINLLMGKGEALITLLINLAGFLGGVYLLKSLKERGIYTMIIYLVFIMSLNVIVMTRDIFNLFVFMEVASIGIAGLVILDKSSKATQAGFKYLIATGVIAGILLIGIAFTYYFAGTLNIDVIQQASIINFKAGSIAVFLVIISIILELKPFPANGWGIDVYEGANPGIGAMISAASASAMLFVLYKLAVLVPESFLQIITAIGILTFVGSNLMGIKQSNANRLLGYSSIGQIGLLTAIVGLKPFLGAQFELIAVSILISHFFAKAGLFWLSGIVKKQNLKDWAMLRQKPYLLVLFGIFIFALIGFPPFPSFLGKWELIMKLAHSHHFYILAFILIGSFLEGIYLFRWLGFSIKMEDANLPPLTVHWNKIIPVVLSALGVLGSGIYFGTITEIAASLKYIPLLFIALLYVIDFLPVYVKNTVSIAGIGYYLYTIYPDLEGFKLIFGLIFLAGGMLTLVAGYFKTGTRKGFYPLVMLMFAGLVGLIEAHTTFEFFFAWELMTAGSYFLIIRGKKSMTHALSYMLFSLAGAYLILAGFGLAHIGQSSYALDILASVQSFAPLVFILLAIGFMTKTASVGLHIWLPGAHAEAETDVSPMVSAILLKAGVFGLILLMLNMGSQFIGSFNIYYALAWIGAITAVMGNMMAAFQEDAKRLLAYSSVGFLGYILFGLSFMSHLGWLAAVSLSVVHFMFKTLLFLAIGGIVYRVKTKEMYKMGGLIKKMPFTFISVLMGIIVIAGVPPLTGFGGKWILYNAVLEKGWFFPSALVFFAGIVAFLYCFRLIHTVFLGQLKDEHREVKEAPFWLLLPQYMILMVIMLFSALPNSLLKPIGAMLAPIFPEGALEWQGQLAKSGFGYWNGQVIMYIVGGIFVVVFAWLWYMNRNAQKVKQFNIGYSAERPSLPETTHFAYNFFAPYKKALGFLVSPLITNFWDSASEGVHAISDKVRRIYNGNVQTYAFHILAFIVVVYLIIF
ncbi:MAG TPA: NADH-quinone oxidoreductase subunit F [Bacteroidales bacterium]|jgi:formate hydrogenlyase subunit 3/multisubunit Na+/H+ antiporter MnhD subunit|nr:NADH-quinone oxidoreductase subunit F [Bacteroidales bacterium]